MSKMTFRNMVKATGLAAVVAAFGGCMNPGERSGSVNMPYIVQPGYSQWNTGVGFWNLSNSAGAGNNSSGQNIEYRTLNYKSGDKYEGYAINTRDNMYAPQGVGKYWFKSGDKYEGEFLKGAMHGRGKLTFKDGRILDGLWEDNEFKGSQISSK